MHHLDLMEAYVSASAKGEFKEGRSKSEQLNCTSTCYFLFFKIKGCFKKINKLGRTAIFEIRCNSMGNSAPLGSRHLRRTRSRKVAVNQNNFLLSLFQY